jgi:RNA polymerase sigma-70 factor (ECF subfamily)
MDDGELVERARQGDLDAYSELVRRHQQLAARVAAVAGAPDPEDAVQEAFVKSYRALPRFRAGSPFRPWLLRIVANEARNRGRSARRQAGLQLRLAAEPSRGAEAPEDAAERSDRRRRLLDAIGKLPERDRLVIGCRYLAELSEAETAATLGWSVGTVKSRLSRAMGRLRTVMAAEMEGSGV